MRKHPTATTDVCIIGAGPVGLFAVFECGMARMRCHVVDTLAAIGGQCVALYPEKPIYDIPGYPRIDAGELIDRLAEQAAPFAPTYHLDQRVERLARVGGRWHVETSAGMRLDCAAVVIAAGVGAFGPNRPPLEGLETFEASGAVRYMVARRDELRDKRVVIAGGGDSAVDWALSLAEVAAHVAVVHRRAKFRAAPESVARLHELADSAKLALVTPFQLAGLDGEADGRLRGVTVQSLDGETRRLAADVLLPFFGLAMALGPIAEWGLNLDHNHIVVDPATCETSSPGVYAIGDIARYPGKLKLILSGFSEAAMAARSAFALARPDEVLHFEYSTVTGVPGQ